MEEKKNKINVIVPFYNCKQYLEGCVSSIMTQKYDNFHVYFIDDASTDNSYEVLPNDPSATIIRNSSRKTALENIYTTIMKYCEKESITILCDGDDKLLNNRVLTFVNSTFEFKKCWVFWGSCLWSDGRKDFSCMYTPEEFKFLRKSPFKFSHLRAFYSGLVHHTPIDQFQNKNHDFYKSCYDVPIMFSISELSGYEKIYHNKIPLYLYNRDNVLNDDKINQKLQTDIHIEVSNKLPLQKIDSYL